MRASIKTLAFGLVFVLLTSAVPRYAQAQEAQPGDACTGGQINLSRWTGGPETSGTGNLLLCNGSTWQPILRYSSTGLLGVRTGTTPYNLTLDGDTANQIIGLTRETTAATNGRDLTLLAGGAVSGGTNLAGGNLILSSGLATGNAPSGNNSIQFHLPPANGSGGTTDRSPVETVKFTHAGLHFASPSSPSAGAAIMFNNRFLGNADAYWNSDSSFEMWHDTSADLLRLMAAPSGTAGNTFTYTDALTINTVGQVSLTSSVRFTGDITSTSLGASQNDYNPAALAGASVIRLTASTPINITGLQGGSDGRVMTLMNVGANAITLVDESASSTAANRFALTQNLSLAADQSTVLIYDSTSSRWRVFGADGLGGGGGTAASPDRGIQFNSGNAFTATSNFVYTSTGDLQIQPGTSNEVSFFNDPNAGNKISISNPVPKWSGNDDPRWGFAMSVAGTNTTGYENGLVFSDSLGSGTSIAAITFYDKTNSSIGVGGLRFKTNDIDSQRAVTRLQIDDQGVVSFMSTGAALLNVGTTAQRPGTPVNGMIRYNSQTAKFEGYQAGAWVDMIGGGGSIDALSDGKTDYTTDFNLWLGQNAGNAIAAGGQYNLAVGINAGDSITTGDENLAIGHGAFEDATTAWGHTAIGRFALGSITNTVENTAVGYRAGVASSGSYNVFVGAQVGNQWSTGNDNVLIGHAVGQLGPVSGDDNVLIGADIASSVPTKAFNNAIILGSAAGTLNDGDNNIFIGFQAGNSVTTGASNLLLGYDVDTPTATTSSHLNIGDTIYGDMANDRIRLGGTGAVSAFSDFEVAGTMAMMLPRGTTAQRPGTPTNGMIRYNSSNAKFEAYEAGAWVNMIGGGGGSPAGSSTQVQFNSGGAFGASGNFVWNNGTAKLTITGDIDYTGLLTDTSDRRLKEDITPLSDRGSVVERLSSVGTYSFSMKDDPNKRREYGVMAQELQPAFPELVRVNDDEMKSMSVNYIGLVPVLIEAVKEQQKQIDALEAEVEALRAGR